MIQTPENHLKSMQQYPSDSYLFSLTRTEFEMQKRKKRVILPLSSTPSPPALENPWPQCLGLGQGGGGNNAWNL